MDTSNFLADCIAFFHTLVVLFVIVVPFLDVTCLLVLHVTFTISLLVHWWANSNVCSLSVLEAQLRGLDYTESFTHKFVAPIYDISKTTWSNIVWLVTVLLLCISFIKLYRSKVWEEVYTCFGNVYRKSLNTETSFIERFQMYVQCLYPLFTWKIKS